MWKWNNVTCEIFEDLPIYWLHTQHPHRFPGFVVDDFFDLFRKCDFLQENHNPIWGDVVLHRKSCNFGTCQNRNILFSKLMNTFSLWSASPAIIAFWLWQLNTNNLIQGRSVFFRDDALAPRGALPTPLWGVEPCSLPGRRPNPNPAIPPAPRRQDTASPWGTNYGGNI